MTRPTARKLGITGRGIQRGRAAARDGAERRKRIAFDHAFDAIIVRRALDFGCTGPAANRARAGSAKTSRPLWFGRFGLAPGLGVRAFSAKRAISSDGQPQLQLSTPSFDLSVKLLFRVSR